MPAPRSTGMPNLDAQTDFLRARRRAALGAMVARLRGEPDDVRHILPYEEVVAALGYVSEHAAGQHVVPLDAIVGTVDRGRDFDRSFRPTTGRVRSRWEHIAAAMRRGEAMPPVDLVRIGQIYFVRDGHHRISVARALGRTDIDAYVTEVVTRVGAERAITLGRAAGQEPRAGVLRARAAARQRPERRSSSPTRGTTAGWPRPSRRGGFGSARIAASRSAGARWPTCGWRTSTAR